MGLTRSEIMSRVKGSNTKPEKKLRTALWHRGFRYRLKKRVEGSHPDIAFPSLRVVVFVDGCFWHGCPEHYRTPKSNSQFWKRKIEDNVQRDQRQNHELQSAGWYVVRVWEHEIRGDFDGALERVVDALKARQVSTSSPER